MDSTTREQIRQAAREACARDRRPLTPAEVVAVRSVLQGVPKEDVAV